MCDCVCVCVCVCIYICMYLYKHKKCNKNATIMQRVKIIFASSLQSECGYIE